MKRNLLIGILGVASATSVFSQGHILISNYLVPPYNQVVWWDGAAVNDTSVPLQIFYGEGEITDESALLPGVTFTVNSTISYDPGAGYGPGGYFTAQSQVLPDWQAGDVYTFQVRGFVPSLTGLFGRTPLWTEQNALVSTGLPANASTMFPAWIPIPEPSSLALAGLGLASMLLLRPRKRARERQPR